MTNLIYCKFLKFQMTFSRLISRSKKINLEENNMPSFTTKLFGGLVVTSLGTYWHTKQPSTPQSNDISSLFGENFHLCPISKHPDHPPRHFLNLINSELTYSKSLDPVRVRNFPCNERDHPDVSILAENHDQKELYAWFLMSQVQKGFDIFLTEEQIKNPYDIPTSELIPFLKGTPAGLKPIHFIPLEPEFIMEQTKKLVADMKVFFKKHDIEWPKPSSEEIRLYNKQKIEFDVEYSLDEPININQLRQLLQTKIERLLFLSFLGYETPEIGPLQHVLSKTDSFVETNIAYRNLHWNSVLKDSLAKTECTLSMKMGARHAVGYLLKILLLDLKETLVEITIDRRMLDLELKDIENTNQITRSELQKNFPRLLDEL